MDDQQARREYWLEQVRAWRESGLTQAGYCRQHDLKSSALGNWIARHKTLNAAFVNADLKLTHFCSKRRFVSDTPPFPPHTAYAAGAVSSLGNRTPAEVYATASGGGARIVDKFSKNGAAPCICKQNGQYSLNQASFCLDGGVHFTGNHTYQTSACISAIFMQNSE